MATDMLRDRVVDTGAVRLQPPDLDFESLKRYRLNRVRASLAESDIDLAILTSPLSLQYALDFDEYQLFQSRIPAVTGFLSPDGPITLCGAYNRTYPLVDDYRPSFRVESFDSGLDFTDQARALASYLRDRLPARSRVAVERIEASTVQALLQAGFEVVDLTGPMERARSIKSPEEIALMRYAFLVAQAGMDAMRRRLEPGVTETELLAELHRVNIAHGGRWMEGRMLCSGPRTNPWLQEATDRRIEAGDMVAFDTDMVGPFGYFSDVSRTWVCGSSPSPVQRDLYRRAYEEVHHNIDLIRPGLSFREWSDRAYRQDPPYIAHRYPCLAHGAGMSDEWPKVCYREDWSEIGYDGEIEADMVLCVESFTGRDDGGEGVKLEQCVLVTETGPEVLSDSPFDPDFFA